MALSIGHASAAQPALQTSQDARAIYIHRKMSPKEIDSDK
jgi:hypothetical protein